MEPFDKDELTEQELNDMLPAWSTPEMPATLKARIFPKPWWQKMWTASIRVPIPVACALFLLLAAVAVQSLRREGKPRPEPGPRAVAPNGQSVAAVAWRPVTELHPRIIRGGNE